MLSVNFFSSFSTSLRPLDDNRSNMLSTMPIKASRLMNLQVLLYHVVWSTRPFGGIRAYVDCASLDSGQVFADFPFRDFGRIS